MLQIGLQANRVRGHGNLVGDVVEQSQVCR
jgi:hypothetical protein